MIVDLNVITYSVKTYFFLIITVVKTLNHVEFISCPAHGLNGSTIRRCVVNRICICLLFIECECMSHKASCSSHRGKKKLAVQALQLDVVTQLW